MIRPRTNRRRAMTLLEILISSTIMLMVSATVLASLIYYMRIMAVQTVRSRFANDARVVESELSFMASTATSFAVTTPSAGRLRLTMNFPAGSEHGASRAYEYRDGDNTPDTIANNTLVEIDAAGADYRTLVTNISPVDGATAVFAPDPNKSMVNINIRFGDRRDEDVAGFQSVTGRGFQTYVLRTAIYPSNAP